MEMGASRALLQQARPPHRVDEPVFGILNARKRSRGGHVTKEGSRRVVMTPTSSTQRESIQSARSVGLRYVNGSEPGIVRKRHGRGFIYVGPNGKTIRSPATLRRIKNLAIPPAWENVWICVAQDGHLQATGRDAKGRKQYIYHPRFRESRNGTKYDRMLAFGSALPRIRKCVERDLRLPGLPKRKVLALVVKLLDQTSLRVGNVEYMRNNGSYGLTTLRDRHARVNGQSVKFRFRGKSGVLRELDLCDPQLAKIVRRCKDVPGQELFQFQTDSGEHHPINSEDVNAYLRDIAGEAVTAKDFRTWHGTTQMLNELLATEAPTSQTQCKKRLVAAIKSTSAMLGNRPGICREYYVHPVVMESYQDGALSASPCPPRTGRILPEEAGVLELVKKSRRKKST